MYELSNKKEWSTSIFVGMILGGVITSSMRLSIWSYMDFNLQLWPGGRQKNKIHSFQNIALEYLIDAPSWLPTYYQT